MSSCFVPECNRPLIFGTRYCRFHNEMNEDPFLKLKEKLLTLEKENEELKNNLDISKCAYCSFVCKTSDLKNDPLIMANHIVEHCQNHPVFKCFQRMDKLNKENEELKEMLLPIYMMLSVYQCPVCNGSQNSGHKPDCKLSRILRGEK